MDISNIDVSLSRGKLFVKTDYILLSVCLFIFCLMPLLTVVFFFIPEIEWDRELIVVLIITNLLSFACMSIPIFLFAKDKKTKSKVRIWLEDAIELKAFVNYVDEKIALLQPAATKIQVNLILDGKHFYKESSVKHSGWQPGYDKFFTKYVNKEVKIMYSPKYDEVMIIKGSAAKN